MVMAVCGDFDPEELLEEIKKRLIKKDREGEIKRIYAPEDESINKKRNNSKNGYRNAYVYDWI